MEEDILVNDEEIEVKLPYGDDTMSEEEEANDG